MNILIACEESQAVCKAFLEKGHNVFSCDLEPCSGGKPDRHIQGDVLPLLDGNCKFKTVDGTEHTISAKWDMLIAFPPCTYMSNAGACRLYPQKGILNQERYEKGLKGKEFFMQFYNADCEKNALKTQCQALFLISQNIHKQYSHINMDTHIAKNLFMAKWVAIATRDTAYH